MNMYVDILVQIIYAKFKNDKEDNGYTGCMKVKKAFCTRLDYSGSVTWHHCLSYARFSWRVYEAWQESAK